VEQLLGEVVAGAVASHYPEDEDEVVAVEAFSQALGFRPEPYRTGVLFSP